MLLIKQLEVGQFIAPVALTIAEALAGGITVGIAQTAFTSAGRAALKDILADTTRKFATFKRGRNIENLMDNPIDPCSITTSSRKYI